MPLQCQLEEPISASPPPRPQRSSRPVRSCAVQECSAAWLVVWLEAPSATAVMAPPPTQSWRRLWGPMREAWGLRGLSGVCFLPACLMILSSGSTAEPQTQQGSLDLPPGSTPSLCHHSLSPPCLAPGVFWPQLCPQPSL